jgi:hypothetical protein
VPAAASTSTSASSASTTPAPPTPPPSTAEAPRTQGADVEDPDVLEAIRKSLQEDDAP